MKFLFNFFTLITASSTEYLNMTMTHEGEYLNSLYLNELFKNDSSYDCDYMALINDDELNFKMQFFPQNIMYKNVLIKYSDDDVLGNFVDPNLVLPYSLYTYVRDEMCSLPLINVRKLFYKSRLSKKKKRLCKFIKHDHSYCFRNKRKH